MLCMIGWVIFDKTRHWLRKSIFHDHTTEQLSLKISELVQDKLEIFVGNLPLHLTGDKKLDLFDNWLYHNRLFQIGQLDKKRLSKPNQWIELIWLIHHQEIYINDFTSFHGSQSLFSFGLTNLNQSVVVQPVIEQVQIFFRSKMERLIFISSKNLKFILNQLGYLRG